MQNTRTICLLLFSLWTLALLSQTPPPRNAAEHSAHARENIQKESQAKQTEPSNLPAAASANQPAGNQGV
jgi:hypothetical protein